jgi:hypothetical protein
MAFARLKRLLRRRRVSKTDAPSLGLVDTLKRRHASPPETQREADIRQAEAEGQWAPTQKDRTRFENPPAPRDSTSINPQGVVDESMLHQRRG